MLNINGALVSARCSFCPKIGFMLGSFRLSLKRGVHFFIKMILSSQRRGHFASSFGQSWSLAWARCASNFEAFRSKPSDLPK